MEETYWKVIETPIYTDSIEFDPKGKEIGRVRKIHNGQRNSK